MSDLKPCAHCGCETIGYSAKVAATGRVRKYHIAMYCEECHCYGPRILVSLPVGQCSKVRGEEYRKLAIEAWNRRANDDLHSGR